MIDWKNTLIAIVALICTTIVFSLMVSGCNGCMQRGHDYRMKQLEYRGR